MVNQKKLESTQKLLAETKEAVFSKRERWNDYILNAAVKFYKYNFEDQLLIHAQRPDATACAEYSMWNSLGRYVRRGNSGVSLLTNVDGRPGLRYVFDISDTGGKEIPPIWSYRGDLHNIVRDSICRSFRLMNVIA